MVIIANIFGGETVRRYFSFVPRNWFDFADQKKWIVIIMTFMMGNILQSMCSSTGAFEVYINHSLVNKI